MTAHQGRLIVFLWALVAAWDRGVALCPWVLAVHLRRQNCGMWGPSPSQGAQMAPAPSSFALCKGMGGRSGGHTHIPRCLLLWASALDPRICESAPGPPSRSLGPRVVLSRSHLSWGRQRGQLSR